MIAVLHLNRMLTRRRCIRLQKMNKPIKVESKTPEVEYCRTCISTDDLVPLFYSKETEAKRTDDLRNVTGLEIKPNDGLSQKICTACVDLMNTALQFRRTSRKTEKALLAMVTGKTRKKRKAKLQKSLKIKKSKVEKEENIDYDYQDDFQNDQDFNDQDDDEDTKPLKMIKQLKPGARKKRMVIPNAPSYKCAQCSKEFRMKATYKAHLRFHTNYCVCEACGKRCRNNNQLQEHKRARHGLGKIHTCAYCEYSSATKEALTIHERRHTGERPYVCDHCGATFHRRSNLVQHIAIHLPEKNFQCTICLKWQKSRKLLQVHVYKVHKAKRYRYTCPDCPKIYKKPEHVRKHLTRVHHVPRDLQGVIDKFIFEPSPLGEPI